MGKHPKILLLPGDGIGPEVMAQLEKIIDALRHETFSPQIEHGLIGGCSYDKYGSPLSDAVLEQARQCHAVMLGAVGAPQYDALERNLRPEMGLLALRKGLGLFANLRPILCRASMAEASTLKADVVSGLDVLIVRELTGDVYFGQPRGVEKDDKGKRSAYNTMVYDEEEIKRIAHVAFAAAQLRTKRLCSIDKANVLEVSGLWREVMEEVSKDYKGVELTHMYVDNAAMQLVRDPHQFNVLVAPNLFGDILSDLAAMLTGSIGLLPSASLNESQQGLYEPVHGSAPDIAGQGIANPVAMILSFALALRFSLQEKGLADRVEQAVDQALLEVRTADINNALSVVSTDEMGDCIAKKLRKTKKDT